MRDTEEPIRVLFIMEEEKKNEPKRSIDLLEQESLTRFDRSKNAGKKKKKRNGTNANQQEASGNNNNNGGNGNNGQINKPQHPQPQQGERRQQGEKRSQPAQENRSRNGNKQQTNSQQRPKGFIKRENVNKEPNKE